MRPGPTLVEFPDDGRDRWTKPLRTVGFRGDIAARKLPWPPLTTAGASAAPAELWRRPGRRAILIVAVSWAGARGLPWRVSRKTARILLVTRRRQSAGVVSSLRKTLDDGHVLRERRRRRAEPGRRSRRSRTPQPSEDSRGIEFGAGIPGRRRRRDRDERGLARVRDRRRRRARHVISSVTGRSRCYDRAAVSGLGYRSSAFRGRGGVALSDELALTEDGKTAVKDRLARFPESRRRISPRSYPSCGSVFLKPAG